MTIRPERWLKLALLALPLLAAPAAWGQVVVEIVGDTAHATIALTDDNGTTYDAEVTITFDTPLGLSVDSLNLTAELVDPVAVNQRLPAGLAVDPRFPMMVTVEPPGTGWLFGSGFDNGDNISQALSFRNTYQIEVHTADLVYEPHSLYRLLKAPVGGAFDDVTEDVRSGSTRARGRGGAFSQFVIAADSRVPLAVASGKALALSGRLVTAILSDVLRLDLVGLVVEIEAALLIPIIGCSHALAPVDQFIATIEAHAGVDIANLWRAQHDVTNDAGELESLAQTLRFSLLTCAE
ncbi:MAG: DUF6689 family protein [Lysobacterales bacterium]